MRLYAFQGLRFNRPAADIDPLVAPPYDQIDDKLRDQLHARDRHQFAWLTRPVAGPVPGEGGDSYRESTRLHAQWLADGTVIRDDEPSLYAYAIDLAGGGRRLGVMCLAGVEDPANGVIRAHEATLDKPLADRVALLKASRVDLEPVFFLSDDGGELDRLLLEELNGSDRAGASPVAQHRDGDGHRHVLTRITDPARIALYRELLAPLSVAIADGHHRYKTACRFAQEVGAEPGTAAGAKMTVVTSISSPGLAIDPIHRALATPLDVAKVAHLVKDRFGLATQDGAEVAAAVAAAKQPAIGVWPSGGNAEVWELDAAQAPHSIPEGARALAVSLLHDMVLATLGFAPETATDGTIIYRSSPQKLAAELAAGTLAVGLLLPPMLPQEFAAAIANGDLLPPKSTRFLPKMFSGLVWADHDSRLG